jgi:hypothetical protein
MPDNTTADVEDLFAAEAKYVQQGMAAADPQAGLDDLKRRLKVAETPKPRVGYTVVCPGWNPHTNRLDAVDLWNLVPLAEAQRFRDLSLSLGCPRTVIVKATTTFEIVEGGGDA